MTEIENENEVIAETLKPALEDDFVEIVDLPKTGNFSDFLNFMKTPTLQDNTISTNDAAPVVEESKTAAPNTTTTSVSTDGKKPIDKGAKYIVLLFDFLAGMLTNALGKLNDDEIEARLFRLKENEKKDLIELSSEIFIEEGWKISPKLVLAGAMLSTYGENIYKSFVYGRNKKKTALKTTVDTTTPVLKRSSKIGVKRGSYKKGGKA